MANSNIASWPSLPGTASALSASLETKADKASLAVNVSDYLPDGYVDNSTNATAAFTAALAAAGPGRSVYVPRGNYVVDALALDKGQTLVGDGWYSQRDALEVFGSANYTSTTILQGTILRSTVTTGDAVYHMDPITHTGGGIRDLAIVGPGSGTSVGVRLGRDAPSVKAIIGAEYHNVLIANFSVGLAAWHVNEAKFYSVFVRGCTKSVSLVHDVNACTWIGLNMQRGTQGLVMESGGSCYTNTFVSPICQNLTGDNWVVRGFDNTWISPYHEHPSNPVGPALLFDFQTGGRNTVICPDVHVTNPMRINIAAASNYNTFELVDVHAARYDVVDAGTSNKFTGDFDTGAALGGGGGNRIVEDRRNAFVQYPSYRATSGSSPSLQSTNFALRNGTSGPQVRWHTTAPESAITAPVGSLCGRTDAGLWYIKQTGSGSTGWFELAAIAFGSATLDFPSIAAGATAELTITVTGAATGEAVSIGPPATLNAGLQVTGYVSATNTVTVRVYNSTGSAVDPASATWKAVVVKR